MSAVTELVPRYILELPSYQPGKPIAAVARDYGLDPTTIIKLASNENPYGMSTLALARLARGTDDGGRYPDADTHELRAALAGHLALDPQQILPGAGSSELISLATRAVLSPGHTAVLSQYAFISYPGAIRAAGATPVVVPAQDYGHDLDAMQRAVTRQTRLVIIASPNNPTGTHSTAPALTAFLEAMPPGVLVILDEAYREYLEPALRIDVAPLLARHPNLLVLRTFSKVYGLAGLRVGYGIGDPVLLDVLRRLQLPFSVNTLAQGAAVAALEDQTFVRTSIAANARDREQLGAALSAMNVSYLPSQGNFLLLRVGDGQGVFRQLLERGIVVRPVANYGLPEWIRVTVGQPAENYQFLDMLRTVLASRHQA